MYSKYVYLVMIFTIGVLTGRMSVDVFTTTNDVANAENTVEDIVQNTLLSKDLGDIVKKNDYQHSDNSAGLVQPSNERFRFIFIEGSSQQDNDWQRVLYESDDLDLKLAAISNLVSDDATEALAIGLGDTSALVRQKTFIGLGIINTENSIRMVAQTLFSDPSIKNRLEAIKILENNFDMPFVEYFLTFTMNHDLDATVRQRAATSLGL
ncbi:HEAT repeat domain-containing protein [Candidatus Colwellia aromaticivorans]|uniref:HEAT repeat domain-containing protein n=1 Tax=Candidatus Colwellia aromaticivorans TaxID=2267621 RepID=UPI000DF15285|nr:hypothetical protein [Candidatus Colwellia aromaticivorans]